MIHCLGQIVDLDVESQGAITQVKVEVGIGEGKYFSGSVHGNRTGQGGGICFVIGVRFIGLFLGKIKSLETFLLLCEEFFLSCCVSQLLL